MKFVYELRDADNTVVHVGQSKDPNRRLYDHTKAQPDGGGHGKFYGRTDITMDVVAGPISLSEAKDLEEQLQIQHGLITDRQKSKRNAKAMRKLTFEIAEEIRNFYATGRYSQYKLAAMYNVSRATIVNIIKNRHYVCP